MIGFRGLRPSHTPLLVEALTQHLDDDARDADVHDARRIPDAHLNADGHYRFVGRQNLQQARFALMAFDAEIDCGNGLPRRAQILKDDSYESVQNALFDFRDLAIQTRGSLATAAQ